MDRIPVPRATFVQLRSFEAVARLGSVTRAARELHLAQPTVSTQLKELASGLGHAVLAPSGRGVRLTEAGVELHKVVQTLFRTWADFEAAVDDQAGQVRGVLRVAGVTTSEYFVAHLLRAFLTAYPEVQIELAVENRGNVAARLDRGDDDCAIMMLPPEDKRLGKLPFLANPLVAIAHAEHAWAHVRAGRRGPSVPLADFFSEPLLMREVGSGTRRVTELHAAEHGVTIEPRMTLGSNEAVKHAVAAGLGVAIVSRHAVTDPETQGLAVIKVESLPIERAWQLVWRTDRGFAPAARAFIDYVRCHANLDPRIV